MVLNYKCRDKNTNTIKVMQKINNNKSKKNSSKDFCLKPFCDAVKFSSLFNLVKNVFYLS